MNCPSCQTELKIADRQGIEIDYCPKCRGVWLDRGELDKLIERSRGVPSHVAQASRPGHVYDPNRDDDRYQRQPSYGYRDHDDDDDRYGYRRKRRGGWLDDIFDFD